MEEMVLNNISNFWHGKRVYVTGHTGFKGAWLCTALLNAGAHVKGYALNPLTNPNMFSTIDLQSRMDSEIGDILHCKQMENSMVEFDPEFVFHLAAQPLVRESYRTPRDTFVTNVIGTVNLFEATRKIKGLCVIINVTTDKVYENLNQIWGYRENDALGGYDPYSASKACSEIVSSSYRSSFFSNTGVSIATARAGNVIGGGDWSNDRLIPDLLKAMASQQDLSIRYPEATRPWQHVIEPVFGYLTLAEKLYFDNTEYDGAWNFGPYQSNQTTVLKIAQQMIELAGSEIKINIEEPSEFHETSLLNLDITKSVNLLNWKPKWTTSEALKKVLEWNDLLSQGFNMFDVTSKQLSDYTKGNM